MEYFRGDFDFLRRGDALVLSIVDSISELKKVKIFLKETFQIL